VGLSRDPDHFCFFCEEERRIDGEFLSPFSFRICRRKKKYIENNSDKTYLLNDGQDPRLIIIISVRANANVDLIRIGVRFVRRCEFEYTKVVSSRCRVVSSFMILHASCRRAGNRDRTMAFGVRSSVFVTTGSVAEGSGQEEPYNTS
jgi:hypothetical protein